MASKNVQNNNYLAIWSTLLDEQTFHNGMILSTLSINSRVFVLDFSKMPHINGDSIC